MALSVTVELQIWENCSQHYYITGKKMCCSIIFSLCSNFDFLQCLNVSDVVIGKVSSKRPFGIMVTLTLLEFGCNRDFTDLNIQVMLLIKSKRFCV